MLKNIKRKDSGFTLVELLIVIVIIAILAVLTLIGVNGYISRANDSKAKDSAGELQTKVAAWDAIEGSYPSTANVQGGMTDSMSTTAGADAPEAVMGGSLTPLIGTSATTLTANVPLWWAPCTASGQTGNTGGTITYWQTAGTQTITVGNC